MNATSPAGSVRVRTAAQAGDWVREQGVEVVAVIDLTAVALAPPEISELLRSLAPVRTVVVEPDPAPIRVHEVERLAARIGGVDAVVAIGGGRTLDAAKLATSGARYLTEQYQDRGGAQYLVPIGTPIPLLAVPTTLGTGSEVSAKAMICTSVGRMLLLGENLRPGCRWIVPDVIESLPRRVIGYGGLEIIGRLLGPWHGLGRTAPPASVADALFVMGSVDTLLSQGASATVRRRAASTLFDLSAQTHLHAGGPQHAPCCYWLWPLANELADVAGLPKMTALTALLPGWSEWLRRTGGADRQFRLWQEAAIRWDLLDTGDTVDESALEQTLDRVDRQWRPVGPGIPDESTLRSLYIRHTTATNRTVRNA